MSLVYQLEQGFVAAEELRVAIEVSAGVGNPHIGAVVRLTTKLGYLMIPVRFMIS